MTDTDKRTRQVNIRLTESEYEALVRIATRHHRTVSYHVTHAILDALNHPHPDEAPERTR